MYSQFEKIKASNILVETNLNFMVLLLGKMTLLKSSQFNSLMTMFIAKMHESEDNRTETNLLNIALSNWPKNKVQEEYFEVIS